MRVCTCFGHWSYVLWGVLGILHGTISHLQQAYASPSPHKNTFNTSPQGVGAHASWFSVFAVLLSVTGVLSLAGWATSGVLCIKLKRAMRSLERAERRSGDDDRVEFQRLPMHEDGHPHDMFRPDT